MTAPPGHLPSVSPRPPRPKTGPDSAARGCRLGPTPQPKRRPQRRPLGPPGHRMPRGCIHCGFHGESIWAVFFLWNMWCISCCLPNSQIQRLAFHKKKVRPWLGMVCKSESLQINHGFIHHQSYKYIIISNYKVITSVSIYLYIHIYSIRIKDLIVHKHLLVMHIHQCYLSEAASAFL